PHASGVLSRTSPPSCRAGLAPPAAPDPEVIPVAHRLARTLLFLVFAGLAFGLVDWYGADLRGLDRQTLWARSAEVKAQRVVYLGSGLTDAGLITLTTTVHASGQPALVLLDSVRGNTYTRAFLNAYAPDRIVPVGSFSEGVADL